MLSRNPWSDPKPISFEIFGPERFEQHAESLADSQTVVRRATPVVSLLERMREDEVALAAAYDKILDDVAAQRDVAPAGEWIIDNFHVVETQVRQIRQDLPPDYFAELPKLGPGFLEGHPRIFGIVWGYVAHTDSLLDPDLLASYIRAYERRKALTVGELWAVAITLRIMLIENLRRVADLVVSESRSRRHADEVADQLLGVNGPAKTIPQIIPDYQRYRPTRVFAVRLARRLAAQQLTEPIAWLDERLAAMGTTINAAVLEHHQLQSNTVVTVRNIFTSLRLINDVSWEDWFEEVSLIEADLRTTPGYRDLDFPTRNRYRSAVEDLARRSGQDEIDVARAASYRARHGHDDLGRDVGYWLIDDGRKELSRALGYRPSLRRRIRNGVRSLGLAGYLGALTLTAAAMLAVTLLLVWWLSDGLGWPALLGLGLLAALPISDAALGVINYLSSRVFDSIPLPGLALRDGVPEHLRTLVVIPTMITSDDGIEELVDRLEVHYLANSGGEIYFALVADWADWPTEHADNDQLLLDKAADGIRQLNAVHGERFLLFHRPRLYNPSENVWMGWERKRGKLDELNRLLRGDRSTGLRIVEGRLPGPIRYVLTLDSDTLLPREAARRLVGKMSHPLNRVEIDPDTGRVTRGYGILQPRVSPALPTDEGASLFQRIFSSPRGMDPYAFAVSDVYQDLFAEGSFTGKGIYDIDVIQTVVSDRVPENTLLSHDLLEGNLARAGLVTDVEVVEEHPQAYEVAASRVHRWTRGDWQLLPWLMRPKGMTALSVWKMLDNLRRSLSPPAIVLAFIAGLAVLPNLAAIVWFVLLVATFFVPPLLPMIRSLPFRKGVTKRSQLRSFGHDLRQGLLLGLFNFLFLPHQAVLLVDAVVRTLYRLLISRRNLLEWTTAAAAAQRARSSVGHYARLMVGGYIVPVALLAVGALGGWLHLAVAAVPAILWFLAPVFAAQASRPVPLVEAEASDQDVAALRLIGRQTWRFFETFVTAQEHYLPPDNFQEDPDPVIASRTSPTNIGLYLLTSISARDLGWIGLPETVRRLEATMATVQELEHFRGHLPNWIDTRTLRPLDPRYISSVDSGNFAGHLVTVANTCSDWVDELDRASLPVRVQGVRDTLAALRLAIDADGTPDQHGRARVVAAADALVRRVATPDWDSLAELAATLAADIEAMTWETEDVPGWGAAVVQTIESLREEAHLSTSERADLRVRLARLAESSMSECLAMDFAFLYDSRRSLLSVGYHVPTGKLDDSCYDLLASEARLASYIAIVKGDIRTRHWFLLGRSVTAVGGGAALKSWSGSMFEYLMPPLVMRSPVDGLLSRTARLVVQRQMEYAESRGIPWGISEAAYNARDVNLTYQYGPFGVPGLGTVRGLSDNLVVAPYATGLASMIEPSAAVANYEALARLGARGSYGFYESVDFTRRRVPTGETCAVVRCYMAHHQGMTIVAIQNVVTNGRMRDRFHADPMIRAGELLLQERAPRDVPVTVPRREESALPVDEVEAATEERVFTGSEVLEPAAHHLSNGRLSLVLTPAGGGQLRWQGMAVTRWHPDPTTEEAGYHIFLRDKTRDETWSATHAPMSGDPSRLDVRLADDRAIFRRRQRRIDTEVEYHLSPESDSLVRRLTITSRRKRDRIITVTSYAELVLAATQDDDAHPAFSKMFVHTEFLPERNVILANRRRRSPSDPEMWAAHLVVAEDGVRGGVGVETDRAAFLGRGNSLRDAQQLHGDGIPTGTTGYVLDPIFSLTQRVEVPAGGRVQLDFWTFVGSSRQEVLDLVDQHSRPGAFERIAMLGWTQSQVQLRFLGVSPAEACLFQELSGHVLHPHPQLRLAESDLASTAAPQSALWPLGISGDIPIVVVRIASIDDLDLVREMIRAFEYWRLRRFSADVVIVNEESTSYLQELHHNLENLAGAIAPESGSKDAAGRFYVIRADQVPAHTMSALFASAAVVLDSQRGGLTSQLPGPRELEPALPTRAAIASEQLPHTRTPSLILTNGYGGFTPDGREYVVVLDENRPTPAPWTNVMANEQFGFLATAEGEGYTWFRNSRDNQLTPWRNDPVSNRISEAVYVRDVETGVIATPTAAPVGAGRHTARHGFGYTEYLHETNELTLDMTQFIPVSDAVKMSWLKVTNRTDQPRRVTVTSYHELVLGMNRHLNGRRLVTEIDPETGALLAHNPWSTQYGDQVVFVDLAGAQDSWTADRREFIGLGGTPAYPRAVASGEPLSGRTGTGLDPCAAMTRTIEIGPGATEEVRIHFGAASSVAEARELILRAREQRPEQVLEEVRAHWAAKVTQVQVRTPDPSFDVMLNGWLLYQSLACRLLARVGYYQASGAFGFRDQLQDGMAVVLVDPALAREHLLRAASRQFPEGDVQHWWLPADGAGVRTRITDDVVWLSHAVARYVTVTGDVGVLDEEVPFLEGRLLEPEEHEAFFTPTVSERTESLYAHCLRGLERAFRYGVHGLPLMGTGDWNDGMNRVGAGGSGESVWLGWFTHTTLTAFLPIVEARGDAAFAARCRAEQEHLRRALETAGWDGAWYRRGYFDNGTPLGSANRSECRIDAIAQSWAVLSGAAAPHRAEQIMREVDSQLIMRPEGIARLFTPPFDVSEPDPGYIRAYPPGVRENGGQYTHGAIWSVFAYAALGHDDRAGELFSMINPVNHARTKAQADVYRVEPYVVAADIYTVEPHVGRGGWTWYTGSSGWLYRAGLEAILGVRRSGDSLELRPCLPPEWTSASVRYEYGGSVYEIEYDAAEGSRRRLVAVELDGEVLPSSVVPLVDDGRTHQVRVIIEPVPPLLAPGSTDTSHAGQA